MFRTKRHQTSQENCFLSVNLPNKNDKGPIVMEQVLSAIHSLNSAVAFEYWSENRRIQFALFCRKPHSSFLTHLFENHYTGIDIEETSDITQNFASISVSHLAFLSLPIFPIRRYSQTADTINRAWTDPYLGILASLKPGDDNEVRGIQIVIRPAPRYWRKRGLDTLTVFDSISEWWVFERCWWFRNLVFRAIHKSTILRNLFVIAVPRKTYRPPQEDPDKIDHRSHLRESVSEAARAKLSQLAFSVTIRLIFGGSMETAKQSLQEIANSFSQFTIAELNGFSMGHVLNPSQNTSRMVRKRASYQPMILSLEELAGMLALPTSEVKMPELARIAFRIMPYLPSSGDTDGIVIGETFRKNIPIKMSSKETGSHTAIIGKTGSGKSTLMLRLIHELIRNGKGVGLFDPHGDLLEKVIEDIPESRFKETVFLDPNDSGYPIAFNVLQGSQRKDIIIASIVDVFRKLFEKSWGPRSEYILTHAVSALAEVPDASLLSIPKLLIDTEYRKNVTRTLYDPMLRQFWEQEYKTMPARLKTESISPILNKINRFLMVPMMRNILGQKTNLVNLREIMDEKRILLLNLSKGLLGEENSRLLGNLFLAHLQSAALGRADIPLKNRRRFTLFIDELQHFASGDTGHIATILSEGRKYRINLVLACQHISQLKELTNTIFGNIGTLIVFGVGHQDAKQIAEYLGEVENEDLLNLPPYHGYLRTTRTNRPNIVSFRTIPLGDIDQDSMKTRIQEYSRKRYARERGDVEAEIRELCAIKLPIP